MYLFIPKDFKLVFNRCNIVHQYNSEIIMKFPSFFLTLSPGMLLPPPRLSLFSS